MNNLLTLAQTFEQTTISLGSVEDFLLGIPRYREAGYAVGVTPYAGRLLLRTDGFEFELRQYLAGESRTLYHLNRSARTFLALDDHAARTMISFSLNAVEAALLDNEWYEIMPRFRKVRQHVQNFLTR